MTTDLDRALALQEKSWTLHAEGRYDEAAATSREALGAIEAIGDISSWDIANILNDLAEIEIDRQRVEEARTIVERARAIEDALGDKFSDEPVRIRTRTLALSAHVRRVTGDYPAAERDLTAALVLARAALGESSPEAIQALNDLAVVYKYWGRFDDGLPLYEAALAAFTAAGRGRSAEAATVYHNIGGILHARGDFTGAEQPARVAWEISRALFGPDDVRTMTHAAAYAAVLDGLDRFDESEPIYRKALVSFERVYGPEHEEVAATLQNLGAALASKGRWEEAERCSRRALDLKRRIFGEATPEAAVAANNLAKMLLERARLKPDTTDAGRQEARALLTAAVAILERTLPAAHPAVAVARRNLADAKILGQETS